MLTLQFMGKFKNLGLLALRLAAGLAFALASGLEKLAPGGEFDAGAHWVAGRGEPAWLMYLVAWTEFLGGLGLAMGLLTRWAALGLFGVVLYGFLEMGAFRDTELAFAWGAASLALLVLGPGRLSLDRLFMGNKAVQDA